MQKRRDIKNFYIDEQFIPVWREFKKICQREDESISHKIRGFIGRYVAVHREGNPQLMLESFTERMDKKCFGCEGIFPILQRVKFISGLVKEVCPECLEDYCGRTLIKKMLNKKC